MLCPFCGKIVRRDADFCWSCGAAQRPVTGATQRLTPPTAAATQRLAPPLTAGLRSGTCPDCGGAEIMTSSDGLQVRSSAAYLQVFYGFLQVRTSPITTFICMDCGLVELALTDRTDLDEIRKHWRRLR